MKTRSILGLVFMFVLAAALVQAATLDTGQTTLEIKPVQEFNVGDTAFLHLHVVSDEGALNFTANVTLTGGSTDFVGEYISNVTDC